MTVTTLVTAWSLVHERLPESWKEKVKFLDIISDRPWYVWALVGLAALLLITLEVTYRLEAARRPKLEIIPDTSEQRHPDRIGVAAILRIRNLGQERIKNCCVRVVDLRYRLKTTVNGEPREYWHPKFEGQDIYLRWSGAGESSTQYFTFPSEAIVEVAVSPRSGSTTYMLGDIKWRTELWLGIGDDHLLTLEVSADNAPTETHTYQLRIDSPPIETIAVPSAFLANEVHFQEVRD